MRYANNNAARDGAWDAQHNLGNRNTYQPGSASWHAYQSTFTHHATIMDTPTPSTAFAPTHIHKPSGSLCSIISRLGDNRAIVNLGDRSAPFPTVLLADLSELPASEQAPALTSFIPPLPDSRPNDTPGPVPTTRPKVTIFKLHLVLTENDCSLLGHILQNEIAAHHNWIASAIDNRNFDYATELTAKLRDYQSIATNLRRTIREANEAAARAPVQTTIQPAPSFNDHKE